MAFAIVTFAAWTAWMVLARVAVVEATPSARLEVEQASHPIQTPVAGRVSRIDLHLGREVRAGDVLFELDADAQRLDLAQARARLAAIAPELGIGGETARVEALGARQLLLGELHRDA